MIIDFKINDFLGVTPEAIALNRKTKLSNELRSALGVGLSALLLWREYSPSGVSPLSLTQLSSNTKF